MRKATWTLDEGGLAEYLEVAENLRLLDADTASQVRLAKDYRNLIHPGRAVRLRKRCDRGTALAALAAVEAVVRDFRRQAP